MKYSPAGSLRFVVVAVGKEGNLVSSVTKGELFVFSFALKQNLRLK